MYLGFTGTASKAFMEENHSIDLEIFCVREDFDAKDAEQRLSGIEILQAVFWLWSTCFRMNSAQEYLQQNYAHTYADQR